jgi:hypothetical protein
MKRGRRCFIACLFYIKRNIEPLVLSVNRELDEEFHLSLFICHLIVAISGGDLDPMPNVHRVISRPMTNEQ